MTRSRPPPTSEPHGRGTQPPKPPGTKRKLSTDINQPAVPVGRSNINTSTSRSPALPPLPNTIPNLLTPANATTAAESSIETPNKRQKASGPELGSERGPEPGPSDTMALPRARPDANASQRLQRAPAATVPDAGRNMVDLTSAATPTPPRKPIGRVKPRSTNPQPYAGPRKLVIKNLQPMERTTPEELMTRYWPKLDGALTAIFEGRDPPGSLEELYRTVEQITRHQGGALLFEQLHERCQKVVQERDRAHLVHQAGVLRSDVELLSAVVAAWVRWKQQVMTIRRIFFFMDRAYLLLSKIHPTMDEMGKKLFREEVFQHDKLQQRVLRAVCELLNSERDGVKDVGNRKLLGDSVRMSHELSVYVKVLDLEIHKTSSLYFHLRGQKETAKGDLAGYIELCGRLMEEEMARCEELALDSGTRRELVTIIEDTMIRHQEEFLVQSAEIHKILDAGLIGPLETLYTLLQRTELLESLEGPWMAFIKSVGASIVDDEARQSDMVMRLLEFKTKLDRVWQKAFKKNDRFGYLLREAFGTFINERRPGSEGKAKQAKPGEMIAKYIDYLLRGGIKAIPSRRSIGGAAAQVIDIDDDDADATKMDEEEELLQELDHVLELFRFIEGKDVFEAFYKKDLARRLLMARSASADAERTMLAKLRSECGAAFTHNLEQMFKDIDLSREEMSTYKQMREDRGQSKHVDLSVNVLSAVAWPNYGEVAVTVPKEIMKVINEFDQYYKSKHSGRHLKWKHQIAHCVVKANFRGGAKELVVSSFQAIVMVLFNDIKEGETLGYKQIQASTGLPDNELIRTLQALACAKYRILNKTPRGRDVNETDSFSVNTNFTDPKYRIKVNQIQLKETKEENKATHEDVNRDRQYEAQAAIVRIMKGRKTITAPELMAETIKLTKNRGALETSEIKTQIDKLIEKDYLERITDGDGRIVYHYLA
ncbi:MAG: Cullin-4A [Watsoniomyces obsoletus]|nr:MAG: Cullin-4A [Watsoniomyces obsoletus]